jgi:hypothetical protein
MPDQSFKTESHGFGVGDGSTGFLRVAEGSLINMKRLFHAAQITIPIQRFQAYPEGLSSLAVVFHRLLTRAAPS